MSAFLPPRYGLEALFLDSARFISDGSFSVESRSELLARGVPLLGKAALSAIPNAAAFAPRRTNSRRLNRLCFIRTMSRDQESGTLVNAPIMIASRARYDNSYRLPAWPKSAFQRDAKSSSEPCRK